MICFDELVEQQRRTSASASALDASNSQASEPDSDKGSCYDSEDSFLDDDELVAELEPSNMKSTIDGFFINTGSMDAEEDPEYGQKGGVVVQHDSGGGGSGGEGKKKKNNNKKKAPEGQPGDGGSSSKRQKLSPVPGGEGSASSPLALAGAPSAVQQPGRSSSESSPVGLSSSGGEPSPRGGGGAVAGAQPRGSCEGSSKPGKKKKAPPLPKIHDGIAARVEDLRAAVESREDDAAVSDPKTLPEWLDKRVKKIERALRLHVAKQTDWQAVRSATLKHLKDLLCPWKLTEAQMRKRGDREAADDEDFAKELGADLCKTLKEVG